VAIINGRISDRSFPRYRLIRPVMAAMLRRVAWIGAQTETIAERFAQLGADRGKIEVIPTLKYDNAQIAQRVAGQDELAAAMGLPRNIAFSSPARRGRGRRRRSWICTRLCVGSTRSCGWRSCPGIPEVVPQVVEAIGRAGLTPVLRTERPDMPAGASDSRNRRLKVTRSLYSTRWASYARCMRWPFAVYVGRSLFKKGGGGSDMIEVAALGKPCCFWAAYGEFCGGGRDAAPAGQRGEGHDAAELTVWRADGWPNRRRRWPWAGGRRS